MQCSHVTGSNGPRRASTLTFHAVMDCNSHWSSQITGLRVLERRGFKSSPPQPLTSGKHNVIGLSHLATALIPFPAERSLRPVARRGSVVPAQFPVPAEGPAPGSPHCSPRVPTRHRRPLGHHHRRWWVERLMQNNGLTCASGGKKYSPQQEKAKCEKQGRLPRQGRRAPLLQLLKERVTGMRCCKSSASRRCPLQLWGQIHDFQPGRCCYGLCSSSRRGFICSLGC